MRQVDTVTQSAGLHWGGDSQLGALPVSAAFSGLPPPPPPFSASIKVVWDYMRLPQQEKGKV